MSDCLCAEVHATSIDVAPIPGAAEGGMIMMMVMMMTMVLLIMTMMEERRAGTKREDGRIGRRRRGTVTRTWGEGEG